MVKRRLVALVMLATGVLASRATADVKLPTIFSDNMVLQRNIPIPIWGTATSGERVTVALESNTAATTAGKDGSWMVRLKPMPAGGPYSVVVAGKNKVTLHGVLIGEVWLCAGQSNMVMKVSQCRDAQSEIAGSEFPLIRCYTTGRAASPTPLKETTGRWQVCGPGTVGAFAATGYFFARDIHKTLNVPIGLIVSAWSGSDQEAFARLEVLNAHPESKPFLKLWEKIETNFPQAEAAFPAKLAEWEKEAKKPRPEGKPEPKRPKAPALETNSNRPASIYNGMIAPLIPFGIRGVLWAGGGANGSRGLMYRVLMPAMIDDWRKSWGLGDFPFFLCQMANWIPKTPNTHWQELRESMLMTADHRNVGTVVTIDIGEPHNIHPKNKQDVGRRLALQAKAKAYGMDVICDGPTYDSMAVDGNAIRLRFRAKSLGGGLAARGGGPLKGFTIAGSDREFVLAQATIDGDTLLVRSDKIVSPVAVRYAWEMNPECNLVNKADLPASPFRTDKWPFWEGVHDSRNAEADTQEP